MSGVRCHWAAVVAAALLFACTANPASATTLRVAPVTVQIPAPAATSSVRIWNDGDTPINVQVRIFEWTQVDGETLLTATNDIAASPPITTLQPGGENIVRIVGLNLPTEGEAAYRLIVDQLPDPMAPEGMGVALVVRHSIPVFFQAPATPPSSPSWSAYLAQDGNYRISVRNDGGTHIKISNLQLLDIAGEPIGGLSGLVGYVLGGSEMSWIVPADVALPTGGLIRIVADGNTGPLDASVRLQGG